MLIKTLYSNVSKSYNFQDLQTRANELLRIFNKNHETGTEDGIKRLLQVYALGIIARDMAPCEIRDSIDEQLKDFLNMTYENVRIKIMNESLERSLN